MAKDMKLPLDDTPAFEQLMSMRPKDETNEAFAAAIEAITARRSEFIAAAAEIRDQRREKLLKLAPADLRKLDERAAELEIAAEQAAALVEELDIRLKAKTIADRRSAIEVERRELDAAKADFGKRLAALYAPFVAGFLDLSHEYEALRQRERGVSTKIGQFNEGEGAETPLEQTAIDLVALAVFEGACLPAPNEAKRGGFIETVHRGRYWSPANPAVDPKEMARLREDELSRHRQHAEAQRRLDAERAVGNHAYAEHNAAVGRREREAAARAGDGHFDNEGVAA